MIDTFGIYSELRDSFGEEPARKMTQVIQKIYEELSQTVRKEDFDQLTAVVGKLAQAQLELAQAQKKTELRVEELAEAQKKTEQKLEELAQAQKKTELRVEELAEAQKKTEAKLEKLIDEHKKTREQIGGLSHTVGYRLEDEAIWALPRLLERDFAIAVKESLKRGYLDIGPNKYIEVNIWGEGHRKGNVISILGEAKTQLKQKDIQAFVKRIHKIKKITEKEIFPVLITYQTSPQVLNEAEKEGIKVYFSFELTTSKGL